MTKYFYHVTESDFEHNRLEPLYFDSFSDASAFIESFLDENPDYPVSIVKVSFNFG